MSANCLPEIIKASPELASLSWNLLWNNCIAWHSHWIWHTHETS